MLQVASTEAQTLLSGLLQRQEQLAAAVQAVAAACKSGHTSLNVDQDCVMQTAEDHSEGCEQSIHGKVDGSSNQQLSQQQQHAAHNAIIDADGKDGMQVDTDMGHQPKQQVASKHQDDSGSSKEQQQLAVHTWQHKRRNKQKPKRANRRVVSSDSDSDMAMDTEDLNSQDKHLPVEAQANKKAGRCMFGGARAVVPDDDSSHSSTDDDFEHRAVNPSSSRSQTADMSSEARVRDAQHQNSARNKRDGAQMPKIRGSGMGTNTRRGRATRSTSRNKPLLQLDPDEEQLGTHQKNTSKQATKACGTAEGLVKAENELQQAAVELADQEGRLMDLKKQINDQV